MRGEKFLVRVQRHAGEGSPPHARGKVVQDHQERLEGGITPACAGKSVSQREYMSLYEDHPRMRGEKTKKIPI